MKNILIIFTLISSSFLYSTPKKSNPADICKMFAENSADSKNLFGDIRKKYIKAHYLMCNINSLTTSSGDKNERDIIKLSKAIEIFETIKTVAKSNLKHALELRAAKYQMQTSYSNIYEKEKLCWNAIFDYSYLLELENNKEYYLDRAFLYHSLGKYVKCCNDLENASSMGSREARNLKDKYNCN